MRLAIVAAALTALSSMLGLFAGSVDAAEGDLWVVDRDNVNVRTGPSTSTEVLMTIDSGEQMVEIAAKGEWYFVEFPDRNAQGWVYGPLLLGPNPDIAPTTAAAPAAEQTAAATAPAPATAPEPAAPEATDDIDAVDAAAAPALAPSESPEPPVEPATQAAAVSIDDEPAAVKSFRDTVAELNERAVSVAGISLFDDVRSTGGGGVQVLATDTWTTVPEAGQTSYMNYLFDRWQSMANGLGPLSLQILDPKGQVMMEQKGS